jgi:hypothetical protein
MKNAVLIFLCMAMLLPEENANAQTDNTQIMKDAQAALAANDYEKAFAGYHAAANDDKNVLHNFLWVFFTKTVGDAQWTKLLPANGLRKQHKVAFRQLSI